jgi:hypothetical protein
MEFEDSFLGLSWISSLDNDREAGFHWQKVIRIIRIRIYFLVNEVR